MQFPDRIPCVVNAQIDGSVSPGLGGAFSVYDDENRSLAATYIAARVLRHALLEESVRLVPLGHSPKVMIERLQAWQE